MAVKLPRLCGSKTLATAAVIHCSGNGVTTQFDVSLAAGRYWFDPIYTNNATMKSADSICALGRFAYELDTADTSQSYANAEYVNIGSQTSGCIYNALIDPSGTNFSVYPNHANTTATGRAFLSTIGYSFLANTTNAALQWNELGSAVPVWVPARGEDGDLDEGETNYANAIRTYSGYSYSTVSALPTKSRVASWRLSAAAVMSRASRYSNLGSAYAQDQSFQGVMWPLLNRGELVRYWSNTSATLNTFLTTAMTASSVTAVVASYTGLAEGMSLCVDGEWMTVLATPGSTTVSVERLNPIAHPKYAPVSTDFVGTYQLSQDGGNVNLGGFNPERVAVNQDRWDISIGLTRALWS